MVSSNQTNEERVIKIRLKMYSWNPDDVERITPFIPSYCYQKQESTWRVDDVDRISPFTPVKQYTWSIDDVEHIKSFVPSNSYTSSSTSSSSTQYSAAMPRTPFIPTSLAPFKNASVLTEMEDSSYTQSRLLEVHCAETRASSSQSLEHDLDTSAEYTELDSTSPKHEDSTSECEPVGKKDFSLHDLLDLINSSNYSSIASHSTEDEPVPVRSNNSDLSTSDECSSSQRSPQHDLNSSAEYLHQSSFDSSGRSSYYSATQCDLHTSVEIQRQNETSNNSVECDLNTSDELIDPKCSYSKRDLTPADSYEEDSRYLSDDDNPLFENAEGSLEMSTEFVVRKPAKDVDFSNHNSGNYCEESRSSKDDEPLLGELESQSITSVHNPYNFDQPCIAATNLIARGVGCSSYSTQDELEEDHIRRRLKMDPNYIPSMGRGSILKMYTNRHKTDKSLNEQLRMTLGVGYSNEATENFWRGEQEESEPVEKPCERCTPSPTEEPAAEPCSSISDSTKRAPEYPIIVTVPVEKYSSPKKTTASPASATAYNTKKTPEYPTIVTVPVEKYSPPKKTTASPASSTSHQAPSPKKKKTATSVRKNRNALLNSLAMQEGPEKRTTPGMPPGALTYVHLDTSNNLTEQTGFHYDKEDFPPLC